MRAIPFLPVITALFLASTVSAQEVETTPDVAETAAFDFTGLLTADSIEGVEIYSIVQGQDTTFWESGDVGNQLELVTTDQSSIGSVEDVIIDRNGAVVGVTTDVGGFLGIGRRTVLLLLEDIRLIAPEDSDIIVVTRLTEEQLEELDELTGVFGYD